MENRPPPVAGLPPRAAWWLPVLLFAAALLWRLPYTLSVQTFFGDEYAFAHPTIRQILRGEFPVYLYSNAYMAPVQEWMAAALIALWGESLATLRLPCVFCGSLAIVLLFRNLLRVVTPGIACGLCLPLVCTNSYTGIYTAFGISSYAIATVFAALLQAATFQVDRRRTLLAWAAFGALGGVSTYVFKILAIQFGLSLVWLLLRSRAWEETVAASRGDPRLRQRLAWIWGIAALSISAIVPFAYHYLTRPDAYQRSLLDALALMIGGSGLVVSAYLGWRIWRGQAAEWRCVCACFALAAACYLPPELYFVLVEKPHLLTQGAEFWEGSRYSLKHAHEWPFQIRFFLERVFATILTGRANELSDGPPTTVTLGWRAALSGALFSAMLAAAAWRWARGERPDWRAPQWLFIAPFFATIALMLPSWQLNNDWSGRYLLPFQIGFHLAVYLVFAPSIHRHPRVFATLLATYALYCGLDTYWTHSRSHPPAIQGTAKIFPKNACMSAHDFLSAASL